jgi:hypothetical protein
MQNSIAKFMTGLPVYGQASWRMRAAFFANIEMTSMHTGCKATL